MKKAWLAAVLLAVLSAAPEAQGVEYLAALGADHPDGIDGEAGARWVRVSGADILSDISVFSDLYVSRDNGRTWETVFENSSKTINWVGANGGSTLGSVTVPVGHYTLARDRTTSEVLTVNVDDGVNPSRQVEVDLEEGQTPEFVTEAVDFTVEENGSTALRFDDPIVRVDLLISWDGATYEVLNSTNDVSRAESTGSRFSTS